MNNEIKIPFSKNKIVLLLFFALLFIFLGIWFTINPELFINTIFRNATVIQIIGIAAILFAVISGFYIIQRLLDKKSGLIINKDGITDHSNATSVGLIKWADIIGIRVVQEFSQKFLVIDVSNPEEYINLKKSGIGKMAMKANLKKYGSPLSITANTLKINFNTLKETIEQQYNKNSL